MVDSLATYRRVIIFILLFLVPAAQALLPIDDPDIWWHLRTGQWIISHGRVPWTDPFSTYGAGKFWIAYSWLFDILMYGIYSAAGLLGLVIFKVAFSLIIALALYLLVRRAGLPFVAEVLITAVALFCLKPVMTPRPWLFSIFLFILELHIIFKTSESVKNSALFFLPLLFAIWANIHVQFIYGLAALALFTFEPLIQKTIHPRGSISSGEPNLRQRLLVMVLSLAATLVTPYHVFLYKPIFEYAVQTQAFQAIEELHPMFFRSPGDWLVLALTLGAGFSLGWRRERRAFIYLLFGMGIFLAFRAKRDVWILIVISLAIIGQWAKNDGSDLARYQFTPGRLMSIAGGVVLSLLALGTYRGITEAGLRRHVASHFPVNAVSYVKTHFLPGPVYNHLDWGGYLIWALPGWPVSMDGRTNLQGEERLQRSLATWAGFPAWDKDPDLNRARLIITKLQLPLYFLLRTDPRFRLVHQDEVAAIFVAADKAK